MPETMNPATANVEAWSGKDRTQENFPVGSLLVRRSLRRHVHAFYDFARNADDIADSPSLAPPDKLARLGVMENVLLGQTEAGAPSAARLRQSLAETGVTDAHSRDLLRAFRQDATQTRYATWPDLLDYCRYSAMPVGRHVLALHGEAPDCIPPSDALSAALQILNHLQDLARDLAGLDRCYLPQDWLAAEGAGMADLRATAETPGLRRVIDRLLDGCDVMNDQAAALPLRVRDWRLRLETGVIVGLARRLTARLRAGDPLATRVKLSRLDVAASLAGAARYLPARQPGARMSLPLGATREDLAVVSRIVRASGTSFYRGMAILQPERRVAMYAVYAFCRLVDDIADEPAAMEIKRVQLDAWRARIEAIAAGQAPSERQPDGAGDDGAVTRVLQLALQKYALRRTDFLAVIDGMQMDAETVIVAPAFDTLDLYCDRVASAVGRLSVRCFGDATPAADEVAHHLGRALQLTNILRDLAEDAARGRLYLPREWLARAGVPPEPAAALASPALPQVCDQTARRARQHFGDAYAAMARCDRRAMKPARIMAGSYAAVLGRLERRGWTRPEVAVSVPKWEKLLITLRVLIT